MLLPASNQDPAAVLTPVHAATMASGQAGPRTKCTLDTTAGKCRPVRQANLILAAAANQGFRVPLP